MGAGFYLSSRAASTRAATAASASAVRRVARKRETQHGRAVVDSDRLQRGAGARRCATRRPSRRTRARRAPRARAAAARRAGPGTRATRCAARAGRPSPSGGRPGTTPASASSAACSKRSRRAATCVLDAVLHGGARQARGDAEPDQARAGSRCRRAGRAPGRRRPTAAPAGRPGAATARRRPAGRAACARRGRRCRRRARAGAGATRPNACTASTCKWGGRALAVARRPEQAGDVGDGLPRAELVVHQHHRHDGGVGAHGRGDGLGADDAVRGRGDDVQRIALAGQRLGAAHDRRVLERADHDVAPARRAGRAQHAQRVGLGAAAGEHHLGGLDVQRRGHLAARLFQGARGRRAPRVRRGGVGVELAPRSRAARPAPRGPAPSRRRCPGKSSDSAL